MTADRNEYRMHHNLVRETLSPEQLQRQADAVAAYHKRLARRAMWNRICMYAFAIVGAGVVVSVFILATN